MERLNTATSTTAAPPPPCIIPQGGILDPQSMTKTQEDTCEENPIILTEDGQEGQNSPPTEGVHLFLASP